MGVNIMDRAQVHEFSFSIPSYDWATGTTVHHENVVDFIVLEAPCFHLCHTTTFVFRLPLTVAQAETFVKWFHYMDMNGGTSFYNFIITSEIVETF